jgi:hypothetical protein
MAATDRATLIMTFLDMYTIQHDGYFDDDDPVVWLQYVDDTDGRVEVCFSVRGDLDVESKEIQCLIEAAMAALFDVHPDLCAANITHVTAPN